MDKYNRVVDAPEIEAKKIFSEVIDYEFKLIDCISKDEFNAPPRVNKDKYFKEFLKEYIKLFLDRSKNIERRNNIK